MSPTPGGGGYSEKYTHLKDNVFGKYIKYVVVQMLDTLTGHCLLFKVTLYCPWANYVPSLEKKVLKISSI